MANAVIVPSKGQIAVSREDMSLIKDIKKSIEQHQHGKRSHPMRHFGTCFFVRPDKRARMAKAALRTPGA
ncbi:MAG TPA: hypothetical protein DCG33_04710 [Prevotellaceae bacterium]|nr:hypothetical protein [Prevotellaceae bacterium]